MKWKKKLTVSMVTRIFCWHVWFCCLHLLISLDLISWFLISLITMVDDATRKTLTNIPLLKTKAGPRDKDQWPQRLKEEFQSLIKVTFSFLFFFFSCSILIVFVFFSILLFMFISMSNKIKTMTTIGFDLSPIKMVQNGLENVGISMSFWDTNLRLNLMWVLFILVDCYFLWLFLSILFVFNRFLSLILRQLLKSLFLS